MPHGILLHSHHPLLKRIHVWELRKYWLLHAFSWKPTKTRNILVRQGSRCTDLSLFYRFLYTLTHPCCYFRQNNYLYYDPVSNKKRKKEWLPDLFSTLRVVFSHLKRCYTKVRASLPLYFCELAKDLSLQKHFRKVSCLGLILFLCSSSLGNKRSNAFLLKEKKLAVLLQ